VHEALKSVEECFSKIREKRFRKDEEVAFRVENTIQYTTFLYYLSNKFYKAGKEEKASYVYYLNKIMHAVELFYAIELPKHFAMDHPLGSVMGRASYGDYFSFCHGCTVGANKNDTYPTIGNYVRMYSNSKVVGNCHIGDHVIISANAYVKDTDIPDNCVVFGQHPNIVIKTGEEELIKFAKEDVWL
jgi:serine O-acetyltransferase